MNVWFTLVYKYSINYSYFQTNILKLNSENCWIYFLSLRKNIGEKYLVEFKKSSITYLVKKKWEKFISVVQNSSTIFKIVKVCFEKFSKWSNLAETLCINILLSTYMKKIDEWLYHFPIKKFRNPIE